MVSRREARARRAATGEVATVSWSAAAEAPAAADVAPVPAAQQSSDAASSAPLTRAGRRIRTAPTPVLPSQADGAVEADAATPSSIPTAAIAWAAAAAAVAAEAPTAAPAEPVLTPAEPFELLEPAADDATTVQDAVADDQAHPADPGQGAFFDVDEFEAAARLFSFTGETPVQAEPSVRAETAAEPGSTGDGAEEPVAAASGAHAPVRRRMRNVGRQRTTASFSVGVMGIVGLLTVGMTTPADAVAAPNGAEPTSLVAAEGERAEVAAEDIQAYVAPGDIQNTTLERSANYSTASLGDIAAEHDITNYSDFFVNDPNAAIQWPFAVGVPITWGYQMRSGRMHRGADFVPGEGAEIQAIADGTVRIATNSGASYGVTVVIDHIIDGQLVSSRYAHMLYGTLNVSVGQQVTVGTILGRTGDTGYSFGAHTHVEILQGGTTAIDPIAWLRANAGRYSLDSE